MIFDKINNAGRYLGISKNLDRALQFLSSQNLLELSDGKHQIDGDDVFINIMDAVTDPDRERDYEYHIHYYDIQTDLTGAEDVLFGSDYDEVTIPYQEDVGFGKCSCEATVHLGPGKFVVCEPGEPHLPGVSPDGNTQTIRKAVIKVRRHEEE